MPSTVISLMDYNRATATLKITFVSGLVYEYKNVPEKIYEDFRASGSKGIYFNENIKGRYDFEKVR